MTHEAAAWRLNPIEALMWRLGASPDLGAAFGSVTILDRAPGVERFRSRIAAAVRDTPRLRQRVRQRGPAGTLWWELDDDFSLDRHLRWNEAAGASETEVLDIAARLVAEPFDDGHPLWTFLVLTGLEGGRAALVQRMHHVITDGRGGIRLSERFLDLERDATGHEPDPFAMPVDPDPPPSWLQRRLVEAVEVPGSLWRAGSEVARWSLGAVRDPGRTARLAGEVIETARSLQRQVAVLDPARSSLFAERTGAQRVLAASVPFAMVRDLATNAGVSVNDVFVAATLRGVAAYHRHLGRPVDQLRVAIPVSTRRDRDATGNAFSPTRVLLPSGDGVTARAHLVEVSERLTTTKRERAVDFVEALAAPAELVPTPLLRGIVRRQAATIDFAASNVRAAPVPLYLGGAAIEATYAIGPLTGTAANITMMSYNGRIDLGFHLDTGAVSHPEELRDRVVAGLHELCALETTTT